jgi:hypothetical protein
MSCRQEILTGILSWYLTRIRSASALRLENSCSSLNLDRMLAVFDDVDGKSCIVFVGSFGGLKAVLCSCRNVGGSRRTKAG